MQLAEVQARMRGAIVAGAPVPALFSGGRDPSMRFAIHRRHYEASLVKALAGKFPALVWLTGEAFVTAAARDFVRQCPPSAPCIAEYGEAFPAFLAGRPQAHACPWLRHAGDLEWRLGHLSLAVEHTPLPLAALQAIDPGQLADCSLVMQPGLDYLAAPWPVDELIALFLEEHRPERFVLDATDVFIELRGARGSFSMSRLSAGDFAFRKALKAGAAIGAAAEQALDADAAFDPGRGLVQIMAAGLVVAAGAQAKES